MWFNKEKGLNQKTMKFLVIGYGSIGQRHANNIKNLLKEGDSLAVCRQPREEEIKGIKTYFDLKDALRDKFDVAIIATPTNTHLPIAMQCAKAGLNLLIEKPLSHNDSKLKDLLKLAQKKTVMIGCNMRFEPGLEKVSQWIKEDKIGKIVCANGTVGQWLPDWRPTQDYSKNYSAKRNMGGGVILDLIHELDYFYWLFGMPKSVACIAQKRSSLNIQTEDTADIILDFKNGMQGNIHLDYIRRVPARNCQIIGEKGTITWDFFAKKCLLEIVGKPLQEFSYSDFDRNDMYVKEMKHFIDCVRNKRIPLIDLKQGMDVLNIALAAKKSAQSAKFIKL